MLITINIGKPYHIKLMFNWSFDLFQQKSAKNHFNAFFSINLKEYFYLMPNLAFTFGSRFFASFTYKRELLSKM